MIIIEWLSTLFLKYFVILNKEIMSFLQPYFHYELDFCTFILKSASYYVLSRVSHIMFIQVMTQYKCRF